MTDKPAAAAAINDARALLAALLDSGWQELHVVTPTSEIFIVRNGARTNPARVSSWGRPAGSAQPPTAAPLPEMKSVVLKAPHLATLTAVAAASSVVARGGTLALLSVLGEESALAATSDCVVERTEAAVGALLEFDQPILSLREVA